MKNLKLIFFGMLFLISGAISAQETATGTVVDTSTGEALPGVGVLVKGTTKGGSTDFDGTFTIENVNQGDVLIFSFMGFKTQELTFDGVALQVSMEEDAAMLDEVMVVGYGSARKKDITGSVALMTEKDFNQGPVANASQMIQGKIPGVSISTGNGAPGSGQQIRIRGTGSLTLSSNPLIVVDGIPLADGGVGGSRNPLNSINPNDIESMSVLKDASATAIYGSRAANGVILIKTKKGKIDQDLKINFSSITGVSEVFDYVDVLDGDQFREAINSTGNQALVSLLGTENTDWQKAIYQTAMNYDNNLSVSGNLGKIPFRVSGGYVKTEGVLKTDEFDRTTAKLAITPSFLDDRLKFDASVNYANIKNQFADNGAIGNAVIMDPTQPIYDENSRYDGYWYYRNDVSNPDSNQNGLAPVNPLALLNLKDDNSTVNRVISNLTGSYSFARIEGLVATVNAGYDYSKGQGSLVVSPDMPSGIEGDAGFVSNYTNEATNSLLDAYLNYTPVLDENNNFSVMGGYSYQAFDYNNTNSSEDLRVNPDDNIVTNNVDKAKSTLVSFFGRMNYGYKDKYLLTATLRADASSKLNPDNRWGIFPSVALAWNISNEDFLSESKTVNNLKLRFGYGQVGNVNGLGDYLFLTRYTASQGGGFYSWGGTPYETYRPEAVNKDLRWEVGSTLNVGIDYGLFDSRIYGSIDLYRKNTQDMIARAILDPFSNYSNGLDQNIGDMVNKGIEVALNVVPVKTDNFEWTVNANFSYNDNEITEMPTPQDVGGIAGGIGNTIQRHEVGNSPYGFYVYEQVYDENQNPIEGLFVDRDGDGTITASDRYFYKDPFADFLIGLNTNMSYRNWDLAFQSRLSYGNYVYDNVASDKGYLAASYQNDILRNISTDYLNSNFQNNNPQTLQSDYYVRNASFFKIDNITLGYTLPKKVLKGVDLRLYASGNNLLIISDYEGIDPEIPGGIDNNFYPRPRIYSFGLNINL